jgi:hypothetical protein
LSRIANGREPEILIPHVPQAAQHIGERPSFGISITIRLQFWVPTTVFRRIAVREDDLSCSKRANFSPETGRVEKRPQVEPNGQ